MASVILFVYLSVFLCFLGGSSRSGIIPCSCSYRTTRQKVCHGAACFLQKFAKRFSCFFVSSRCFFPGCSWGFGCSWHFERGRSFRRGRFCCFGCGGAFRCCRSCTFGGSRFRGSGLWSSSSFRRCGFSTLRRGCFRGRLGSSLRGDRNRAFRCCSCFRGRRRSALRRCRFGGSLGGGLRGREGCAFRRGGFHNINVHFGIKSPGPHSLPTRLPCRGSQRSRCRPGLLRPHWGQSKQYVPLHRSQLGQTLPGPAA